MSTISSVGSSLSSALLSSTQRAQRPDPSKMVDNLFSQLDTLGKGYLEVSDLQSAFAQIASATTSSSGTSTSSASADEVFSKLDSNSDGKVTKDEMSSGMKQLADELDSQFNQMRMNGAPPPPPPQGGQDDAGFTKDELSSQLSDIGSTDSERSDLITKIVNNFEKADTDEDGKVSFKEAMAYDEQTKTASSTSTSSTTSSTSASSTTDSDLAIMKRIMELMQSYASNETSSNSLLSTLSVTV